MAAAEMTTGSHGGSADVGPANRRAGMTTERPAVAWGQRLMKPEASGRSRCRCR
jgi:hypothetical protein